jgi:hypothetical protein
MEWAQSISARSGQLVVSTFDVRGQQSFCGLDELHERGLPIETETAPRPERICLSELVETTADGYLEAFGIRARSSENQHAVYALRRERSTIVIPALALIRGCYQPTRILLAEMFRPQALHRMAYTDPSDIRRIRIVAPWSRNHFVKERSPVRVLEWLLNDPSARQLANSVHENAMCGRIGFNFSPLELDVNISGIRRGTTIFATSVTVQRALLSSASAYAAGELHSLLALASNGAAGVSRTPLHVERGPDGRLQLSAEEWDSVRTRLRMSRKPRTSENDLKEVFENILLKLTSDETSWQGMKSLGIDPQRHKAYHRRWSHSGDFTDMVDELNRLRAPVNSTT